MPSNKLEQAAIASRNVLIAINNYDNVADAILKYGKYD